MSLVSQGLRKEQKIRSRDDLGTPSTGGGEGQVVEDCRRKVVQSPELRMGTGLILKPVLTTKVLPTRTENVDDPYYTFFFYFYNRIQMLFVPTCVVNFVLIRE